MSADSFSPWTPPLPPGGLTSLDGLFPMDPPPPSRGSHQLRWAKSGRERVGPGPSPPVRWRILASGAACRGGSRRGRAFCPHYLHGPASKRATSSQGARIAKRHPTHRMAEAEVVSTEDLSFVDKLSHLDRGLQVFLSGLFLGLTVLVVTIVQMCRAAFSNEGDYGVEELAPAAAPVAPKQQLRPHATAQIRPASPPGKRTSGPKSAKRNISAASTADSSM